MRRFVAVLALIVAMFGGVSASPALAWRALKSDAQRAANDVNWRHCGDGSYWYGCSDFTAPGAFSTGACEPYGYHSWLCHTGMKEFNLLGVARFCATTVHVYHLGVLHYRKCGKLLW